MAKKKQSKTPNIKIQPVRGLADLEDGVGMTKRTRAKRKIDSDADESSPATHHSRGSRTGSTRRGKSVTVSGTGSSTSFNDLIDGESMGGGPLVQKRREVYGIQSPGVGGFMGTPLFMGGSRSHIRTLSATDAISPDVVAEVLPSSLNVLKLILSMSSHRSTRAGILRPWMVGSDLSTVSGRLQLLTALLCILNDMKTGASAGGISHLTWEDIQYLQEAKSELADDGSEGENVYYLASVVLEIAMQRDLSLKFRLLNIVDFSDQITTRGWMDGGRDSKGTLSEELREWFYWNWGQKPKANGQNGMGDVSPRNNPDRSALFVSSSENQESMFSVDAVARVFGDMGMDSPKKMMLDKHEGCREIVVVDVQTDHALRRHINKAVELRKESPNDHTFVRELKKFIVRRVHAKTSSSETTIEDMAKANDGFVHIGEIKAGAESRHFAILFKTLCDATGVYCRLVRDPADVYYNVVMISDRSADLDVGVAPTRTTRLSVANECDADEEILAETPEELIPVFWEASSTASAESRVRLAHPLDRLLQQCNATSDPVDLDDFFMFDKMLGKGAFGEVWKVEIKALSKNKKSGSSVLVPGPMGSGPFALKLIPPEEADKEEASFMRIYCHAQIVSVIAVFRGFQVLENRKRELEQKPAMCILMQLANKSLESFLSGSPTDQQETSTRSSTSTVWNPIDIKFAFRVLLDSARAMAYLHSPVAQRPHLVHRDLKPANILITKDLRAMITDFGVARMNPSLETNLTVGPGTEGYMAPEQKTLLYDRPADVYSFGIIIARVIGVKNWKETPRLSFQDFINASGDPFLAELCMKCVQTSPLHRPSFDQIHQVLLSEFIKREFACTIVGRVSEPTPTAKSVRRVLKQRITPVAATPSKKDPTPKIKAPKRKARKI